MTTKPCGTALGETRGGNALVLNASSLHRRGFLPFPHLNDPVAALTGMQAVFGLFIEMTFIVTFTQRFFTRWLSAWGCPIHSRITVAGCYQSQRRILAMPSSCAQETPPNQRWLGEPAKRELA